MDFCLAERKLPTGISEFDSLIKDLKDNYKESLPTQDEDSLKFVVATTIMHMGPLDSHKSLDFFYKTIVAGASKQVSHSVFREIKLKQEKLLQEAAANEPKSEV